MPHIDAATLAHFAGLRVIARGQPPDRPSQVERRTTHLGVSFSLIAEVLVRARSELARPERWCQLYAGIVQGRTQVLDADDLTIYGERQITAMCGEGAITFAAFWIVPPTARPDFRQVASAAIDLFEIACGQDINEWNDEAERTQAEMVAMFERAIHMAVMP